MSITFRFHPQRTIEAAAMFLKLHGKPMKYLGLLKMLYIADRMFLEKVDRPITGDYAYSMKFGPVLSSVYDLIKGKNANDALPLWREFITTSVGEHSVFLIKEPENDYISGLAQKTIQEVYAKFGHLDPFEVAEWTHGLPEWQKPPEHSRIDIVVDDVLKYLERTDKEIEDIRLVEARESYLDMVLAA